MLKKIDGQGRKTAVLLGLEGASHKRVADVLRKHNYAPMDFFPPAQMTERDLVVAFPYHVSKDIIEDSVARIREKAGKVRILVLGEPGPDFNSDMLDVVPPHIDDIERFLAGQDAEDR